MAFSSAGRIGGGKSNSVFARGFVGRKKMDGRSSETVMAYVGFPNLKEEYETLRLSPGATEKDVKKAFRRLALQYHPDVCKGDNCGVRFHKINEAYETVMSNFAKPSQQNCYAADNYMESMMGVNDDSWEDWEEWMGWEGAGTRDYSNHINIYA